MEKNRFYGRGVPVMNWKKWSRMTRLGFLLLICLQFSAYATGRAQGMKVSLDMHNVTLEQVLKELKAQTGMRFFYSVEKARGEQKEVVKMTDISLEEALRQVLDGTNVHNHPNIILQAMLPDRSSTDGEELHAFDIEFKRLNDEVIDFSKHEYKLAVVFSSSFWGDRYEGTPGSELIVDDAKIITEDDEVVSSY